MQEPGPASANETGPIPAVGIPDKYKQECSWGDCPIYSCQHCRDNGTFRPERFNYLSAEDLAGYRSIKTEAGEARRPHSGVEMREFRPEAELNVSRLPSGSRCEPREFRPEPTVAPKVSGPFLNDLQIRAILEGWGIKHDGVGRDPINEGLSRGHFGKGRPGMENRDR